MTLTVKDIAECIKAKGGPIAVQLTVIIDEIEIDETNLDLAAAHGDTFIGWLSNPDLKACDAKVVEP